MLRCVYTNTIRISIIISYCVDHDLISHYTLNSVKQFRLPRNRAKSNTLISILPLKTYVVSSVCGEGRRDEDFTRFSRIF